ncbi:GNAT family N-acetyltransferase [Azospirillum sp. SYSU D00513]|uniref:GNAT family N-acetyltransferase n=1 Tax=Azospirillum sp. SYSU D00513 TaxID=2812561 RepID=UPI001A96A14D|nr:GNAT family N-acetyltransferase [Azospirillum sp. SYSU D00513]
MIADPAPAGARWRAMEAADIDRVLRVADIVHLDYPEGREVYEERMALFPLGCRVAERGGAVIGYAVMHPGRLGAPPPLDSRLGALPDPADCLYIHDVALLPEARGTGLGAGALAHARSLALDLGLGRLALTSTPPARGYWERLGFAPYGEADAALAAKLASYGGAMTYMTVRVEG